MTRRFFSSICVFLVGAALSCSSDDGVTPENGNPVTGIGPQGGVITASSGDAVVSVPPGAVPSGKIDVKITKNDRSGYPDPGGRYTDVFVLGPDGADFDAPVTVCFWLPDSLADSTATLWTLNETSNLWEELPLSYNAGGLVCGQTTHFSAFSGAPASAPDECNFRESIPLRTPGNVEVLPANQDAQFLIGAGTLFEQETGSRWQALLRTVTVQGIAGPPEGTGLWIDFATGPNFETGTFDIAADGTFSFEIDMPPLGFRYLGITDACLSPYATATNGWYYNAEIWCGNDCEENVNVPPCQFPETVALEPGQAGDETFFAFLEEPPSCELGPNITLTRAMVFRANTPFGRTATVIAGVHRWEILSSSHGSSNQPADRWTELPDATDITMTLRDAFDNQAPIYELKFRFDGLNFTVRSFVRL
jgi:hypothetical protein